MIIKLLVIAIIALLAGLFIGMGLVFTMMDKKTHEGEIVLDKNEAGDDRITFLLGMEYDDISKFDRITFRVNKKGL